MNSGRNMFVSRPSRRGRSTLLLILGSLLFGLPCAAQTCDYTVSSLADSGDGTLRTGLADATAANICFGVQGTITLSSALQVSRPVTITATGVTISGNNTLRLLDSQSNPVSGALAGTLTQSPSDHGGVIEAVFADLSVNTAGTYQLFATDAISSSANPAYSATSNAFQISQPQVVTVSWQPAPLTYEPMPQSELNATATINGSPATGTFVYTFIATGATINVGQVYPAGVYEVQVIFTPAESTSQYTLKTALQITQATPVMNWPTPAAIFTSTPLSATQLNATATGVTGAALPGTFLYNPAAGTTLSAGSHVLSTTFTPTDATDYTTATAQVTIQVNAPTAATVTMQESANPITFGQSETFTAMVTGSDGQPFSGGTAAFTSDGAAIGSATVANGAASITATSLTAGTHQIALSFTDSSLSAPLTGSAMLTVNKADPVIAWPTPSPIFTVTPLSSTQLDATATGVNRAPLPGTFVYSPAEGATLPAGTQTLNTTFTPTDIADYTIVTAHVTIQVGYSTIAITSVSPGKATLSTSPLPITLIGSGFTSTSEVQINGTPVATTVQSSTALTATIPASDLAKAETLSISVYDPASKYSSNTVLLAVAAPTANVTFSISPNTGSGEQPAIGIQLNSPYPSDLQGALTLAFAPSGSSGVDDPAIQFSTGGRTASFSVPAGSTTAPQLALQTGTVAGTITVTLALTAGGVDVTPPGLSPITLVIGPAAPVITSVKFTNGASSQVTVVVSGFSNTRDMQQAEFVFTGSGAKSLRASKVDVSVTGLFTPWYSSSGSDQYGSEFTYTQNFQLSKPDQSLTGVSVTLANTAGTSESVNSQ